MKLTLRPIEVKGDLNTEMVKFLLTQHTVFIVRKQIFQIKILNEIGVGQVSKSLPFCGDWDFPTIDLNSLTSEGHRKVIHITKIVHHTMSNESVQRYQHY